MTRILVCYATSQGHTGGLAARAAERLRAKGLTVDLWNAEEPAPSTQPPDAVLLLGSVHMGAHQDALERAARASAPIWTGKKVAFVSSSLSATSKDPKEVAAAQAIAEKFLKEAGLGAAPVHLAAGAVHERELNWVTRWLMREILKRHGLPQDPSGDTVLTDYAAFDGFVDLFAAGL
jgi:menaquinone-dependent protoporphyrinogen oxidase